MENDELTLDNEDITKSRNENRFTKLTEKLTDAEKEKAELAKGKADAEAKTLEAEKNANFYKEFASSSSKYPGASEYQDAIKEKVMAGYTVEDAAVAVLAREGKLNNYTPPVRQDSPAGGSATNQIANRADKPLNEMNKSDMRAELQRIEDEGGGVSTILRRGMV